MFELNLFNALLLVVAGFLLLCKSADILVDGAVAVAEGFGISPMVIGLTIVSIGTSAPELAASMMAALESSGAVAVGNVMGSNIANLALIGGFCAIIKPVKVNLRMLKIEMPVMAAAAVLLFPMLLKGEISRIEGAVLLMVFAGLITALAKTTKKENVKDMLSVAAAVPKNVEKQLTAGKAWALIAAGFLGLAIGAKLSITGAVYLGRVAGLSEAVIGITIVAIGTSLPELITSIVALGKSQDDISVGNLIGSNVFNTLLVIGAAAMLSPLKVDRELLIRDFPVMLAVSVLFVVLSLWKKAVTRQSGILLVCVYITYTALLISIK